MPIVPVGHIAASGRRICFGYDFIISAETFKGHKNGLRADLAQAIADIHPRFVRFPGGCLVDMVTEWIISITGKKQLARWKPENLHLISGDIIRHEVWDILNISSSVKI